MCDNNPFAALFNDNKNVVEDTKTEPKPCVENTLEEIFGFTLNPKHSDRKELLLLEEYHNANKEATLNIENLCHALFDRLFMCNCENAQIVKYSKKHFTNKHAYEHKPIIYLFTAYCKLHENNSLKEDVKSKVKDLILQNASTAVISPDIFEGQHLHIQMVDVIKEGTNITNQFFTETFDRVLVEENNSDDNLRTFIGNMIKHIRLENVKSSLINLDYTIFNVFKTFTLNEFVANMFIDFIQPERPHIGSDYANTALGALFNISILPKVPSGTYEHFLEPMDHASNSRIEGILWINIEQLNDHIHSFVLSLLKCSPKIKDRTLGWFANCLKSNADRGKLWNSQAPPELNPANYTTVTDGFMINLSNLMLRLCQPFCTNSKILKVDPTYCSVSNEEAQSRGVHMQDLNKETCFLPLETDEEKKLVTNNYNFVTECFFMTHKVIDLGFRVAVDKLLRMNIEMGRIERAFNDAIQQSGGNSDIVETLKDRMKEDLTKYLSLKCQLSDPNLSKMLFDLNSASSFWLSQIVVHTNQTDTTNYAPLNEIQINFPLPDRIPLTLKCIPEFLVENIVSYLVFLRRFNPKIFEEEGFDKLSPILTFVLIYMGSQYHLKNPHIRARLAEGLESLLPHHKDVPSGLNSLGGYQRELLFTQHPHRLYIVEMLLNVFVGIEMTGQSVEFEQKFNYRRPMYVIIEYLWEMNDHMECFKKLAEIAEQNMEAVNPPLFLRFANLLMNDAIFLLDEALANMAKIKEMQHAQENGEWARLSERERTQNVSYMHHIGMMARFDNILGRNTIKTLEKLTSKITNVFTHTTMVDRIAGMLNYFLLNLVGPNKKNFKVKDSKEYSFEPASTVLDICNIYINLKESDAFCLAISQDGRSYSPNLFSLAEDVLARIGGGLLIGELQKVAERVAQKAKEYKASEEATAEAPEHYLDPIMSTLMTDPVILPSSKQTVDRTTIARHLLSDQTDPFNRSPLSMDQVIPNKELAEEIKQWLAERLK